MFLLTFLDDKHAAIPPFSIVHTPLQYACLDYQPSTSYWRVAVQTCDPPVLLVVHRCWEDQRHTWDDMLLYNLQVRIRILNTLFISA